jgi:DNA-binding MarR family transcriptional regulator
VHDHRRHRTQPPPERVENEELSLVADSLDRLRKLLSQPAPADASLSNSDRANQAAQRLYKMRRRRERTLPGYFGEPAWDILLDLMIARIDARPRSISCLCVASNVSSSTALRWITKLLDDGLIYKTQDPADGRRTYVALRPEAAAALEALLINA